MINLKLSWGRSCSNYIDIHGCWRYQDGRAYLSIGRGTGTDHRSILIQLYRPGASLGIHTDGPKINRAVAFELWRPREGRLEVMSHPRNRSWLRGRVQFFDGGSSPHKVTKCSGYRVSLLFQHGVW